MLNTHNTSAAQSTKVSNVLLYTHAVQVKEPEVGYIFTSRDFAKGWDSIYFRPSDKNLGEARVGMRKLTSPTLVITSHSNSMAFIIASEKTPVYIPSAFHKGNEGYLIAARLAPTVTPEYMFYMCQYEIWHRTVQSALELDDWEAVGVFSYDPYTNTELTIEPLDIIRNACVFDELPSVQGQKEAVLAAQEQEEKIKTISAPRFDVTTVFANFLLNSRNRNILTNQVYGLLVECYNRKLGSNADERVLNIMKSYYDDFNKSIIAPEELDFLSENIGQLFDLVVNPTTYSHSEDSSFIQPKEVTDFICSTLNISDDIVVYNPFAGTASYAVSLPNPVVGEELDPITWALAQIRLAGNKVNPQTVINWADSFESMSDSKRYKVIVSSPSYLTQKGHEIFDIVEKLYDKLEDGGKMICVVTSQFLNSNSDGYQRVKERLIAEKAIKSVITLPDNIFANTSISQAIIVLEKGDSNHILFADGSTFTRFSKSSLRPTTFDYQHFQAKAEEAVFYNAENGNKVVETSVAAYIEYNNLIGTRLTPAYYLTPRPQNGVRLSDLVQLVDTSLTKDKGRGYPVVMGKDLSSTYLNCNINWKELPTSYSGFIKVVENDCLAAFFLNGLCKVGKLSGVSSESPIALHSALIAFSKKSDTITEEFLLRSIMSDDFNRQAKSLQTRYGLTPENFLEIEIEVPSIEEQNRLCKEDANKTLNEADQLLLKAHEEFRKDMHMKKHAIGQTIFNLNNWWNILSRARREGNGILDESSTVGNSHKVLIRDIFDNLRQSIDQLQQQISKFDRGNGLVPEQFALTEFIEQYISTHKSPMFEFQYDSTKHRATKSLPMVEFDENDMPIAISDENILSEGDPLEYITFPKEALTIIFDNIISNACAHGFTNSESSAGDNLIRIDIISEGLNYIVEISNNGAPLDKNISTEDVFTYGKSISIGKSHFGIGGYEVFRLMKEFNSDAELISDPTNDFPVKYRLIFKDTNIIATIG